MERDIKNVSNKSRFVCDNFDHIYVVAYLTALHDNVTSVRAGQNKGLNLQSLDNY